MYTKVYIRKVYFIDIENNLISYSGIKYRFYDMAFFVSACSNKPFKRPEGVYGIFLGVGPTMPTHLPLLLSDSYIIYFFNLQCHSIL